MVGHGHVITRCHAEMDVAFLHWVAVLMHNIHSGKTGSISCELPLKLVNSKHICRFHSLLFDALVSQRQDWQHQAVA
jgi:hypothetical protein